MQLRGEQMSEANNNFERFSTRVANYVKYRPDYPNQLIDTLVEQLGLTPASSIADIGAGTGIFSQLLLNTGLSVTAVEPNQKMLAAAKVQLNNHPDFSFRNNSAEQTGLTSHSLDLITVAQAFHWFNNDASIQEFKRILKPKGQLALLWNQRDLDCEFQQQYHQLLLKYCESYDSVNHMNLSSEKIKQYYSPNDVQVFEFRHVQYLDHQSLLGRLLSTSYCPASHAAQFSGLSADLKALFEKYENKGNIEFNYICKLYLGRLHV